MTRSEDVRQRDVFGKRRIAAGVYTSGQIDVPAWAEEIEANNALVRGAGSGSEPAPAGRGKRSSSIFCATPKFPRGGLRGFSA